LEHCRKTIAAVVLGDIARSPRMMNHARALAESGVEAVLIGYPPNAVTGAGFALPLGVRFQPLHPLPRAGERVSQTRYVLRSAWRMWLLFLELTAVLWRMRPAAVLMQNPPGFPTLAAACIGARARGARLVIDWHNLGASLLGLRLGPRHPVVRLLGWHESWSGRWCADAHVCVSQAMAAALARQGIFAEALYDMPLAAPPSRDPEHRVGRRLIAVCPAGWGLDEDMSLLLDALERLTPQAAAAWELHLTGTGPGLDTLMPRIHGLRGRGLSIHTGYLAPSDYQALLARADLGLSLHRSSSGLDLAMKVVDILAAGVPVAALDYGPVLREQLQHGENGLIFADADELAGQLSTLARDPSGLDNLAAEGLGWGGRAPWLDCWRAIMPRLLCT
jgi:beta-1,4-mannosyltransferase